MTPQQAISEHHQLCDELHQLTLEENRFLRSQQRAPDAPVQARKKELLERLDRSLESLRELPAASARDPETRAQLDKTRDRILQILQLDKENEQLLLRCSLSRPTSAPGATAAPAASAAMLQKIYSRVS